MQLIEREARGASLTQAGEAAVERARGILSDTADLVSAAQQAGAPLTGAFRLGAIPTIAPFLIAEDAESSAGRASKLETLFARRPNRPPARGFAQSQAGCGAHCAALGSGWCGNDGPWEKMSFCSLRRPDIRLRIGTTSNHQICSTRMCFCWRMAIVCATMRSRFVALPSKRGGADVTATSLPTLVHMVAGGLGVSLLPKLAIDAGVTSGADVDLQAFETPIDWAPDRHRLAHGIAARQRSQNDWRNRSRCDLGRRGGLSVIDMRGQIVLSAEYALIEFAFPFRNSRRNCGCRRSHW